MGSNDVERSGIVLARRAGCALAPSGRCFRPKGLRSLAYGLRLGQSFEKQGPRALLFCYCVLLAYESELSTLEGRNNKTRTCFCKSLFFKTL